MTTQVEDTSVRVSVLVEAPIEHAFKVFTEDMGTWWPRDHHIIEGEIESITFEPRVGGHVYDRTVDGRESRWSRVLAYEPPDRVVFSWDVSNQFTLQTDPAKTSEIEVTFAEDGPDRTRVVLEHRNLDRHGDGWEQHRDAVSLPDGWQMGLNAFAAAAAR
jgi:uncharacterized protein YndB with AHSA1/START domain